MFPFDQQARLDTATCIDDLRLRTRRRIPKAIFDYIDGGSYTEATLRRNREVLAAYPIRQKVLRDITNRDMSLKLLGEDLSLPIMLAPTGLAGLVHPNGEIASYKAATGEGTAFCLSTASINAAADLAGQAERPFWFQIYVMKDRDFTRYLMRNAWDAGARVLVITVDLVVNAQRHKDVRNGLAVPFRVTLPTALDAMTKPGWFLRMAQSKRRSFGNFEGYMKAGDTALSMAAWVAEQYQPLLTPDSLAWIRDEWQGQIVIKGVLDPDDAVTAKDFGADAVVVSNHGGRQLDGTFSPLEVLPEIRAAVGDAYPVIADSGIRTGGDIFRMLQAGADACMIGRAFLWGLGAGGGAGVRKSLDILRKELDATMALAGCRSLADIRNGPGAR